MKIMYPKLQFGKKRLRTDGIGKVKKNESSLETLSGKGERNSREATAQ